MHRAKTFDQRVDDFRNVITFLTIINIKQHFKTLEDYFKSTDNKKAYHLHIDDKKVVRRLSHTKRESLLRKLLEATKGDFIYHKHCHRTYAGGRFRLNSWFEIPESRLRELFADASNFNTATCKFLTKQQHKWIDEHVFYIETKDKDMTKAQEKEIREKEARGELALPADYVITQEKKKERAIEKQKISIAKKAVKATISEYAKIMAENESLKHEVESLKGEINRLKAICDSNSDIPEEAPDHKLSFEEFVVKYPDGIDPDAFDFDTLSDECKAKLQAERDEEQTKIDNTDVDYDFKKLSEAFAVAQAELHAKPTNVFVAPPELAEKKVVETPADDIPTPTSEEVTKLERQINRLQEFVNKLYISVNEARQIASFFGRSLDLKEARGGWCVEDAHKHKGQRSKIFGYFKHELDNHQLVTDGAAKFFKGRV